MKDYADNSLPIALIVEDDPDICFLLSSILRQRKLTSNVVNNLSDAKESFGKNTPGVVILDNHLPDGLGVEFITFIKANYPSTKIILITAHDTFSDRMKALTKGADYFIGKPFTRATMNTTLENLNY